MLTILFLFLIIFKMIFHQISIIVISVLIIKKNKVKQLYVNMYYLIYNSEMLTNHIKFNFSV